MTKPMSEKMSDNERLRRFRLMAGQMAKMIDWPGEEKMVHASYLCVCSLCGLSYGDHPAENGLVLTCDGRTWKL